MRDDWQLDPSAPGGGQQLTLIERFIDDTQRGTREQFVTAFVLMVRSLGVRRPGRDRVPGSARVDRVTVAARLGHGVRLAGGAVRRRRLGGVRPGPSRSRPTGRGPAATAPDAQTPAAAQPPIAPPTDEVDDQDDDGDRGRCRYRPVERAAAGAGARRRRRVARPAPDPARRRCDPRRSSGRVAVAVAATRTRLGGSVVSGPTPPIRSSTPA